MAAMDSVLTDPANSALVWLLARPTACERAVLSLGGPAQAAQDPAKAARAAAAAELTAAREGQGASQQQCRPHAEKSAAAAALQAPHRRRTGRGEVDRRRRYAAESSCQEDSTKVAIIKQTGAGNGRTEADGRRSAWLAEEFAAQDEKSATRLQARHRGQRHRGRLVGASVEHQGAAQQSASGGAMDVIDDDGSHVSSPPQPKKSPLAPYQTLLELVQVWTQSPPPAPPSLEPRLGCLFSFCEHALLSLPAGDISD